MEMQLPFIHRLLQLLHPSKSASSYPPLVPIMVGSTSPSVEKGFGQILAPYIADPENAFVISSDFCHWGSRFGYTYYIPSAPSPVKDPTNLPPSSFSEDASLHTDPHLGIGQNLASRDKPPREPRIYESIAHMDRACMCAITSGSHDAFLDTLRATGNTICGRHPIGVLMAGVEEVRKQQGPATGEDGTARFTFVRYERSSDVQSVRDSSVSYVSGFMVL